MTATVRIARDSHGVRLHLTDRSDINILMELGPYDFIEDGGSLHFVPAQDGTLTVHDINDQDAGLRDGTASSQELVENRFGPYEVEVDLYNEDGFSVELPPIHLLPWPQLQFCDGYCLRTQLATCIVERVKSLAEASNKSVRDVARTMRIPTRLRREISGETHRQIQGMLS